MLRKLNVIVFQLETIMKHRSNTVRENIDKTIFPQKKNFDNHDLVM